MTTNVPGKKHELERILDAESEHQVTTAINQLGRQFDMSWKPLGDTSNNYGVVENQASSPLAALNEIISNGIDATLRRRYKEKYNDTYQEKHDLTSYEEASDDLLTGREEVRMIADGERKGPVNITVRDGGEGQSHEDFESSFLDLLEAGAGKRDWPFLQGQFGMGSTAVLPHSGNRAYKLIVSAGFRNPEEWTWTIVRRNEAGFAFEYLLLNEELPGFQGQLRGKSSGTFIKMYEYDLPSKSQITAGLRYKLARTMTQVPVPLVMDERRNYHSDMMEGDVLGFKDLIERNPGYIKNHVNRKYDFGGKIGERDVELVVFKRNEIVKQDEDLDLSHGKHRKFVTHAKQTDRAVFFTVNGQVHGDKGLSFIKNRCDKYHSAKDTVALVDFSDLGRAELTHLFTPARDRLQDKPMAKRLESGMQDLITNDPMLEEEEQFRQEQFSKDKRDEKMNEIMDELIKRNPALRPYLEDGDRVGDDNTETSTDEVDEPEPYISPFFPTKLLPLDQNGQVWKDDDRIEIEVPMNRTRYISFLMNAPNDFFTREDRPGTAIIQPKDVVQSNGLTNGTWTIQLKNLEAAEPGMTVPVSVTVGARDMDQLKTQFNIKYVEPIEEGSDGPKSSDDEIENFEDLDFPKINAIYRDGWDGFQPSMDVDDPVRITGSGDNLELNVNFDAAPIKAFMSRHNLRKVGKTTVRETWKAGVAMYALSTYIEVEEAFDTERVNPHHVSEISMKGIVQSMLDQHLSEDEIEKLTV